MRSLNALTLDDDPNFNQLIKLKLKDLNISVTTTLTVKSFLEEFVNKNWDFCLIDLNIKDDLETGFKVIGVLRQKLKTTIPLIILSRSDEPEKIAHGIECGADDYLTKPIDVGMIASKINYLMSSDRELAAQNLLGTSSVPRPYRKASLLFELKIIEISVEGIELESKSIMSKGSTVTLSGQLIEEVFKQTEVKLMVLRNSKLTNIGYSLFCEFGEDEELAAAAKGWILQRKSM